MKSFLLMALLTLFITSTYAQKIQLKTTRGDILTYGDQARITTNDSAVVHTILTINLPANTAGVFEVSVSGVDSAGNAITGSYLVRYNKKSGTLTLGTPQSQLTSVTDAALAPSVWAMTTTGNQFNVTVRGNGPTIRWRTLVKHIFP